MKKPITLSFFLVASAFAQTPTYTTVTVQVNTGQSPAKWNGALQISSPVAIGTPAAAIGQWAQTYPIQNGATLTIGLAPNDTMMPTGYQYVFQFRPANGNGSPWFQYCTVPTSSSPVAYQDICTVPGQSPSVPPSFSVTAPLIYTVTTAVESCPTCGVTSQPLSQFASTTSAQLRGVISDETGTGAAYFVGGALGTPASGTATNLTGLPTAGLTGTLQSAQEPAHMGDMTNTAGSLATHVVGLNGTNLAGLGTGLVKNTTGTGVPSIGVPGVDYAPPVSPTAAQLPKFRAAVANTRNGGRDTKVLLPGDSTTYGIGSDLYTTYPSVGSMPARLTAALNLSTIPTLQGLTMATPPTTGTDQRWSLGSGWQQNGTFVAGFSGLSIYAPSGTSNALTFTPLASQGTYDSYAVGYTTFSGQTGANISVTAYTGSTAGSTTTVSTNTGTNGIAYLTVAAPSAGTNTSVHITGSVIADVIWVEPFLSTQSCVRIGMAGPPGSATASWNQPSASYPWGSIAAIKAYAPDLCIINLGINNAVQQSSGVDVSAFTNDMQAMINACKVSGDVILDTIYPSDATVSWLVPNEQLLYAATLALAATNSIPVIDVWARFGGSYNSPFMYSGGGSNGTHPNNVGYYDSAAAHAAFISSIIGSW